jgi:prolyl oligopeptidase
MIRVLTGRRQARRCRFNGEAFMKAIITLFGICLALTTVSVAGPLTRPAPAPVRPVTETLWGRSVTDNYRYMEAVGPETVAWMKAQGAYTRALMDSIKPRAALAGRVAALTASFAPIQGYAVYGGRAFYEKRGLGSDNFDLMVRNSDGERKLVDIAALRASHGGKPYSINYFLASPDGSKVAVGISEGGSEAAVLTVYDAVTGKQIAGPIDRTDFGATAWSDDSTQLFFIRLKKLSPGEPATDKYKNVTADAWNLKAKPVPVAGNGIGGRDLFAPGEFPAINLAPTAPRAVLLSINGVQNELRAWTAPVADASSPEAPWKPLVDRKDDVTDIEMRGNEIYLLSHKDAPTFKVLVVNAGQPLSAARVLVPVEPNRVVEAIKPAADGLYVLADRGSYTELLRIRAGTTRIEVVELPFKGHVTEMFGDPRRPGVAVNLSSWGVPLQEYRYDPAAQRFVDLGIEAPGAFQPSRYIVSDLAAPARDGVAVPLSLVQPRDKPLPQITVIEAYGSYGISNFADFSDRRAAMMNEGITYGVCHVRGGGENGDAWRLAGKDANKHNTWEDLIACGRYLIARGITTSKNLFIIGGSAGGITMGRAMEEAPDLFAGVIDVVPASNTIRAEFSPNGPPNIPEFGTIKTEQGFRNLYAMDSIQHVKPGVVYPAILISTGLNDPRVSPWEPAKLTAALQASGTPNPVLLRVDAQAGHGIGSTKSQGDELTADWIAFVSWRAGLRDWQPTVSQ